MSGARATAASASILLAALLATGLLAGLTACANGPAAGEEDWWSDVDGGAASCGAGLDKCDGDEGEDGAADEPAPPDPAPTCAPLACEHVGATCGPADDGCGGTLDCGTCAEGTACVDGSCACAADSAEPNDVPGLAHDLGHFSDRPRTTRVSSDFGLDREADSDWFTLFVDDRFGDGNPTVTVTLDAIPEGATYEVAVWFTCEGGGGGGDCREGSPDDRIGAGCAATAEGGQQARVQLQTSCDGSSEDGRAVIRVRSETWTPACVPYDLEVDVN